MQLQLGVFCFVFLILKAKCSKWSCKSLPPERAEIDCIFYILYNIGLRSVVKSTKSCLYSNDKISVTCKMCKCNFMQSPRAE